MKLPSIVYQDGIRKGTQVKFGGLNHNLGAGDGELWDMRNLTSDYYPLLASRGRRRLFRTLTKGNGLFSWDALAWADGTKFFYGGIERGSVEDNEKTFCALGAYLIILPDKKYYNTLTGEFGSLESEWAGTSLTFTNGKLFEEEAKANTIQCAGVDWSAYFKAGDAVTISGCTKHTENNKTPVIREIDGDKMYFYEYAFTLDGDKGETPYTESGNMTVRRTVPMLRYICENENRLWGCDDTTIYASKLGDPFNWNVYEGLDTDSYAVDTGSAGKFTGCVSFLFTKKGILPVAALNAYKGTGWKEDMMSLIQANHIPGLTKWYNEGGKEELETIPGVVPAEEVVYAPLYRNPKRIFGIGLNYADHAKDIGNAAPTGFPGSFFKMADTLIGPNDDILLPKLKEAQKTTAEAELGIIMGRDCRDVPEEEWESAIVGYTTILDMTEESILKGNDFVPGNPRYLTIVKNFPTFFSFGPQLVTPDEVPDVLKLEVQSVHNGEIHAKNTVDHMTHVPSRLVSLHSSIQGWYAGDVLSTGTPRAFHIQDGDIAECRIVGPDGFEMEPLKNPVVDLKLH